MNLNKSISWKIALPIGIVLAVIGHGGVIGLVGDIMVIFGIVDLITVTIKRRKGAKVEAPK